MARCNLKIYWGDFFLLQRESGWVSLIFYPPFYLQKGGETSKMGGGTSKMVSSLLLGETF